MGAPYHETEQPKTRRVLDGTAMLDMAGGAMKWEALARRVFRHAPSATMVRQLLFWGDKGRDPEGYVYKSYGEWWDEEGLTRTGLDTARRRLGSGPEGLGVLEEKRKGRAPCTIHYRLNLKQLQKVMFPELESPAREDPVLEDGALNPDSRVQGFRKQVCRDTAGKFAGKGPSHSKEYAENTSENPSARRGSAEASSPGEGVPEMASRCEGLPSGKELVERMQARLKSQGYALLSADECKMYGHNYKLLMASDSPSRREMLELVDLIVDGWGRNSLASPQEIYREYFLGIRDGSLFMDDDEDELMPGIAGLEDFDAEVGSAFLPETPEDDWRTGGNDFDGFDEDVEAMLDSIDRVRE